MNIITVEPNILSINMRMIENKLGATYFIIHGNVLRPRGPDDFGVADEVNHDAQGSGKYFHC